MVWFAQLDASNPSTTPTITSSIYIARQGEIVYASCTGVNVHPVTYPGPSATGPNINGYKISVNAGQLGRFEFVASAARMVGEGDGSFGGGKRWIGEFEGGFVGAKSDGGVALWETMGPDEGS